jgi:hypothetical protein
MPRFGLVLSTQPRYCTISPTNRVMPVFPQVGKPLPSDRVRFGQFELNVRTGELYPADATDGSQRVLLRLWDYVYPAYIRGLAYLELGDGKSAAAQFQKLIDNPGFTVRHVIGPLARLQLGRAQKMMGDEAAELGSYETFLDLWKNADPDIPIYQQAKAEYAELVVHPS